MPKYIVTCENDLVIKNWKCNQPLSIESLNTCSSCADYVTEDEYCTAAKIFGRVVARHMFPNDFCSKWKAKQDE